MKLSGKISKLDLEVGYGFVRCPKFDEIFFSVKTDLGELKLVDLKVDDSVQVIVRETGRGYFAESLILKSSKISTRDAVRDPEANL